MKNTSRLGLGGVSVGGRRLQRANIPGLPNPRMPESSKGIAWAALLAWNQAGFSLLQRESFRRLMEGPLAGGTRD